MLVSLGKINTESCTLPRLLGDRIVVFYNFLVRGYNKEINKNMKNLYKHITIVTRARPLCCSQPIPFRLNKLQALTIRPQYDLIALPIKATMSLRTISTLRVAEPILPFKEDGEKLNPWFITGFSAPPSPPKGGMRGGRGIFFFSNYL